VGFGFNRGPKQTICTATPAGLYDIDEALLAFKGGSAIKAGLFFGAEGEASIGVIGEKSPFNSSHPPGPNLVGSLI